MNLFHELQYLMIETNSECNLKCSFCNREELAQLGQRKPQKLDLETYKTVLEKFKKCKINTIKIEGLSEPMLHADFHHLAEMTKKEFPNAYLIVATNLQYKVSATPLLETIPHIDMLYLSIDGIGKTYEELRKPAKFSTLIKSLEDIKSLVSEEERKSKLHINFTCNEHNYRELPEIYKIKDYYGFSSVRINLTQNWNENELNTNRFDDQLINFLKDYKSDIKGVPFWSYQKCFWPFAGMIIDVFGNLRQCIINTSQKPIANIFDSDLEDIFTSGKHYLRVRENLRNNQPPEECINCDYHHLKNPLQKIFSPEDKYDIGRNFFDPLKPEIKK